MLKYSIIVISVFLINLSSFAQDNPTYDKSTLKKAKKELKKMSVEDFHKFMTDYEGLNNEAPTLNNQLTALEGQAKRQEEEISSLSKQIETLNSQISSIQENCDSSSSVSSSNSEDYTKGLVFKVQVGAFRDEVLKSFLEDPNSNFWEEDTDGIKKYTIGYFREYFEADKFKKMLRDIGVKDAWIVAYENNKRKDVEDAVGEED